MDLERYDITQDFGDFYRQQGFVVLTDLFDTGELERARTEIADLFRSRFSAIGRSDGGDDLLASEYATNREAWKQCASRMWDLPAVYGLAVGEPVQSALPRLGLEEPLISTRPEVRTDMPGDEQYMQPWHQDWRYGQGSLNSVTFWIPLHDVTTEHGTIDLIPGSHLSGYLEVEELSNPRRFQILDGQVDETRAVPAELRFGEAIVFSQFLVHRSGHNTSGKPRLTTQQRFSDHAEPRFAAAGFPTPTGSELVWDETPSESDLREVFRTDRSALGASPSG